MIFPSIGVETMLAVFANMEDFRPYNKMLDLHSRTSSRAPSLAPSQFTFHNGSGSHDRQRVIRASAVGYIAPKFEGKKTQMVEG